VNPDGVIQLVRDLGIRRTESGGTIAGALCLHLQWRCPSNWQRRAYPEGV